MSLSPKTIEVVKSTAAPVAANAQAITTRMYEILFADFPETKVLFEGSNPDQHKKLAMAISAYAANIDNLTMLSMAVEKMASTHVLKKIKPEHYPMVGTSILKAIKDVLGDTATDEVLDAWKEAYFFLADILIVREKELYAQA
jgi:nitric oxide dioxygenase